MTPRLAALAGKWSAGADGVDGGMSPGHIHSAPDGRRLLLGSGGLRVEVEQDSRAALPAFKLLTGAVTLDEKDYLHAN